MAKFDNVADQYEFRMEGIDSWINSLSIDTKQIKAVIGRGAPLRPLEGGSYKITETMLSDLRTMKYSNHASNLGAIIADHLGKRYEVPCLISDPITTDNFTDIARISGVPEIPRKCRAHALNIKEVCRREAEKLGKKLEEVNYVAVHMGVVFQLRRYRAVGLLMSTMRCWVWDHFRPTAPAPCRSAVWSNSATPANSPKKR